MAESKKDIHEQAKRNLKMVWDTEAAQREREKEDLEFQVGELQWTPLARQERSSEGRPMLSISLLHQPMQLVKNQARNSHLGVEFMPVSEKADPECAEVKQDLYRRIERDSLAFQARLWALDRALHCGRGYYRVNTKWDEDGDDPFDQEIVIERILYQENVYLDPSAQRPDSSDGKWGCIVAWVPLEDYRAMYPNADLAMDENFLAFGHCEPLWVKGSGETRAVLMGDYFRRTVDRKEIPRKNGPPRVMETVSVELAKISGAEPHSVHPWNGRLIPIIPVLGRELQPFDEERRYEGMVRPAKDGQRLYNMGATTLLERMAMEPKVPFIGYEGQFDGWENDWKQANRRPMPYLQVKPLTLDGKPAPIPQRAQLDQTGMSLAVIAVQEGKNFVQGSTAIYDPSLGNQARGKEVQSGVAIARLQSQGSEGTSNYIDALVQAMYYEARVVLDMMPRVYDRAGRVVQVLGSEEEPRMVMLNAPHVTGQDGRPEAVGNGYKGAKTYDLNKGKYSISISVGKSHQTQLEEGAEEIGQIMQADPAMAPLMTPTYLRFRHFPGSKELSELAKKYRDHHMPYLAQPEEGEEPTPEQLEAALQAAQGQIQQLTQQLQQAAQAIQTDQVKQQAMLEKSKMDNETKRSIADMNVKLELLLAQMKGAVEAQKTASQHAHEDEENAEDRAHEMGMAAAAAATPVAPDLNFKESMDQPLDQNDTV